MHADNSQKKSLKQRAVHEFEEVVILTVYLLFFFLALATYSAFLLGQFHISYFAYGTALINALVIAKVILIGEALHAGTRYEKKAALLYSAIWKAFVFGFLVFAFHLLEEMIKNLIHGKAAMTAFHEVRLEVLLSRAVVIFLTFIPLFLFRELRRVIGEEKFMTLVLHSPTAETQSGSEASANLAP
jgi:hypothetical protein